jgi:phospholipid/cholesterol/gamma-HCH transport system substrate-binding protein
MTAESSIKVKTGIFVLAGIGVCLFLVFLIGSQQNLFSSTIKLHVNYRNVVGLREGAFVRFNGINAGVVDLIDIRDDTTVRVEISVQKKIHPYIKTDSRANISSDGLMGDKLIQILPGNQQSSQIKEGGELEAVNPMDMDKVMARMEKVGIKVEAIIGNVDTISGHLAGIFSKVNEGKGTLGKLVNSEKLSNDIEQTITAAKKTAKTADAAAEGLKENMEAAKSNILLRGYFKKKERKRIKDSVDRAKKLQKGDAGKED